MVRWASGVTKIRQRAVGVAEVATGGLEGHAIGPDVVAEDAAQLVGAQLADVAGPAAERGEAGDGIGGRAAGDLDRRGPWRHRAPSPAAASIRVMVPLFSPCLRQEVFLGMGQDIDNGIADTHDVEQTCVERPFGHGRSLTLHLEKTGLGSGSREFGGNQPAPENRGGLCPGGGPLARPAPGRIMASRSELSAHVLRPSARSLGQFDDPRVRAVVWKSLAGALLVLRDLGRPVLVSGRLDGLGAGPLGRLGGPCRDLLLTLVLVWFLFPVAVTAVASLLPGRGGRGGRGPLLPRPARPPLAEPRRPASRHAPLRRRRPVS